MEPIIGLSIAFAIGRILLGLAPFVAVTPLLRVFGIPKEEDTTTARLFARLFGVRDIGSARWLAAEGSAG